MKSFGNFSSGL